MLQNLLLKIVNLAKVAADYIVNLYASEWLFRLLTIVATIITIAIPVLAFTRYLTRLIMKNKEVPEYRHLVIRDFTRVTIEDRRGSIAKQFQEIQIIPGVPGKSSFTWILATSGILEDFSVYPGEIKAIYKEAGRTHVLQDFKKVLNKGESIVCSISYTARNAYTKTSEYYGANVYNFTKTLTLEIIFPPKRPPKSLHVLTVSGTPIYTERLKPIIGKTETGLLKATWTKKKVRPGTFKIVWEW